MKFERKIRKVGDSLSFSIPVDVCKYVRLNEGDDIEIMADEGKHGLFISFWKKEDDKNGEEKNL
jgi:antitoxin component of MazEF toxin-antitoxin module